MEQLESLYGNLVAGAQINSNGTISGASLGITVTAPVASVYAVTLTDPIDLTDSVILTTVLGATFGNASPIQASDSLINVSTFDVAGAAGDRAFYIGVFSRRASPGRFGSGIGRLAAAAQVDAAGAIVGKSFGITGAPVLAASIYTYTLSPAIDPAHCLIFANAVGSTARYVNASGASDTSFAVLSATEAGAAADIAHVVSVWRFRV